MVMPGVRALGAGRRDAHILQTEMDFQFRGDGIGVFDVDKVDFRSGGRQCRSARALLRHRNNARSNHETEESRNQTGRTPIPYPSLANDAHRSAPSFRRAAITIIDWIAIGHQITCVASTLPSAR